MGEEQRLSLNALRVMALLYQASTPQASTQQRSDHRHYGLSLSRATGLGNGTLYPILDKLEDVGLIAGEWEDIDPVREGRRPRRYYHLTGDGVRRFERERQKLFGGVETGAAGAVAYA